MLLDLTLLLSHVIPSHLPSGQSVCSLFPHLRFCFACLFVLFEEFQSMEPYVTHSFVFGFVTVIFLRFVHVVYLSSLFLLLQSTSHLHGYILQIIRLPVDRHLNCLQLGDIMNKAVYEY